MSQLQAQAQVQARLSSFSLVGDSNVRRNLTSSVTTDRPTMANAQLIPSGRLSSFASALESVRLEADACVISCVSNFLLTSSSGSGLTSRVDKVLTDFFAKIRTFCLARPHLSVFVCPPMYRTNPIWYRDGLPEILLKFSEVGTSSRPDNLHLMPSFTRSVLEEDGVHLTPFSGMEFVLSLFKTPEALLTSLTKDVEEQVDDLRSDTRLLQDRVLVLERDHKRLNDRFDYQTAVDSELRDYEENIRNESFIMVRGLARLPKLDPKEWQIRAVADVEKILASMGFDSAVKYVQNVTGKGKNPVIHYKVRVQSAEVSKAIREKFSSFFANGQDSRPASLSNISIRNCVTAATLGRIALLQLFGRRYTKSNPGSRFTVIGYEARPLLKLFPSQTATDKRVLTFNFIEAISKLPACFTTEETADVIKRITPKLHSRLKEIFVIISQDSLRRPSRPSSRRPQAEEADPEAGSEASPTPNVSGSESSPIFVPGRGSKRRVGSLDAPSAKK